MIDHVTLEIGTGAVEPQRANVTLHKPVKDVIAELAQKRLRASPYRGVQALQCEHHEGVLVLRGRVPSYYHKQMAQEAVRNLSCVEMILNVVEVVEPNDL